MKIFILTTVMAPYRVQLFSEIGKYCELYVCFEQMRSLERNDNWYDKSSVGFQLVNLKKWDVSVNVIKLEIIKQVQEIKPDIIIAYEYHTPTALLLLSYCQLMKIPYVINCDGAFISRSIKDSIKKFYISKASGFISSGKMADEYLLHYGAAKENVFYNHFTSLHKDDILKSLPSLEEKKIARQKKGISEKKMVLSVGQFVYRKGYDILLKAATNLADDVGVYIIGGEATPEYVELVRELNLKNIHFIDFMSLTELKHYYISADLFVLPTREDVWGLVINEAMAFGLPIVTTDRCVAGIEMIKDGINGYLVPANDYEALGFAMNQVLADEAEKRNMAYENLRIISNYTYETSAQDIVGGIERTYNRSKALQK